MNCIVVESLKEPARPGLYPDISEREMYAIGKMTATWALLESLLMQITLDIAKYSGHHLPTDFVENNSLNMMLRELKKLIKLIKRPEALKRRLGTIVQRANALKAHRHISTHGIFWWDMVKPGSIKVLTPKKRKPQEFDAKKIEELAQKIAELNFEISYPHGIGEFYREKIKTGYGMSRQFAILMTGTESDDPMVQVLRKKLKSEGS